jgi:hypothetical protein
MLNISTSYHPQTNGQTERVNQTWEQVIRCYVHPSHGDWVQYLTNVEFAINAAVSTSTNMSPYKATLGFEPTSPTTAIFEDNEPNRTLPEQVKIRVEMHKFAYDKFKATLAHMQEAANRHRLPVSFRVGDKVKLKATYLRFVYNGHVLNYATATLDCFSLRRKFLRMHFNLSYPMEYGFVIL